MTLEVLFTCPRTSIKHLSSIRVQLQVYSLPCAPQYPSLMKVMEISHPLPLKDFVPMLVLVVVVLFLNEKLLYLFGHDYL